MGRDPRKKQKKNREEAREGEQLGAPRAQEEEGLRRGLGPRELGSRADV